MSKYIENAKRYEIWDKVIKVCEDNHRIAIPVRNLAAIVQNPIPITDAEVYSFLTETSRCLHKYSNVMCYTDRQNIVDIANSILNELQFNCEFKVDGLFKSFELPVFSGKLFGESYNNIGMEMLYNLMSEKYEKLLDESEDN